MGEYYVGIKSVVELSLCSGFTYYLGTSAERSFESCLLLPLFAVKVYFNSFSAGLCTLYESDIYSILAVTFYNEILCIYIQIL